MSQKGFSQLFFLIGIVLILGLIVSTVQAQSAFIPPFYCMGIGADCLDTPESSISPAHTLQSDQPCSADQHSGSSNFFSNFLHFFNTLFHLNSGSGGNPPCTPIEATSGVLHGNSTNPFHPEPTSQKIQFINHNVAQVPGEDMFITVSKPNNTRPGDILVAMVGSDYAHVDSAPAGWRLIRQDVKNTGHIDDLALQSYYKIVTPNEDESYTWNLETGRKDTPSEGQPLIAVDLYAFRGVDQNNPIFSSGMNGETEDPQAIECPSINGIAGGMLLCAYIGDDPGSITMPKSMQQTSDFKIHEGDSYAIGYESLTSNDDTGPRIARWDNPGRNKNGSLKSGSDFAHAVVLRPTK